MTAQSLKKASDLFKQKHAEIIKFFPFFKNEFAKDPIIKEGKVEIYFKNGSFVGILPNTNDAKGSRANCIVGEESALMDKEVFDDAIGKGFLFFRQRIRKRKAHRLGRFWDRLGLFPLKNNASTTIYFAVFRSQVSRIRIAAAGTNKRIAHTSL